MCFGADLKSNKLIVLIVQPTQVLLKDLDLSLPLRLITEILIFSAAYQLKKYSYQESPYLGQRVTSSAACYI